MRVVVLDELLQDPFEVLGSGDQEVIEAFAASSRCSEAQRETGGAMSAPMKPVALTVVDTNTAEWQLFPVEYLQHQRQVAWSADQQVVEAFAAQRADEALGDRVRPRCPDWGADDADVGAGEHGVEGGE